MVPDGFIIFNYLLLALSYWFILRRYYRRQYKIALQNESFEGSYWLYVNTLETRNHLPIKNSVYRLVYIVWIIVSFVLIIFADKGNL